MSLNPTQIEDFHKKVEYLCIKMSTDISRIIEVEPMKVQTDPFKPLSKFLKQSLKLELKKKNKSIDENLKRNDTLYP